MPAMDPDSIPTEPIIDPGPLDATAVAPGPSQASGVTDGRSWTRDGDPPRGHRAGARADVQCWDRGRTVGATRRGRRRHDDPEPNRPPDLRPGARPDRAGLGDPPRSVRGADQLDDQALAYGAIRGLTEAVGDTGHTSFLTPEERAQRADELSGSYAGIGVRIDIAKDGFPVIDAVFRGSPAEKAGLKPGDEITEVDGKTTAGHDLDEVAGWVRGEAGSTVSIEVRTGADGAEREVSIVRADVAEVVVSWAMVPGTKTAFLRLDQFSHGAADEVKAALGEIKAAGADRLIFDLRGNPGGYVNEAVGVASQFLSSGDVYVERDAAGHETRHPVSPEAWPRTCRSSCWSTAEPRARPRSCPARSRTPGAARSSA